MKSGETNGQQCFAGHEIFRTAARAVLFCVFFIVPTVRAPTMVDAQTKLQEPGRPVPREPARRVNDLIDVTGETVGTEPVRDNQPLALETWNEGPYKITTFTLPTGEEEAENDVAENPGGNVRERRSPSGRRAAAPEINPEPVPAVWTADRTHLILLNGEDTIHRIEIATSNLENSCRFRSAISSLTNSAVGLVVAFPETGRVMILDPVTLVIRKAFAVPDIAFATGSPQHEFLVCETDSHRVFVVDLRTGKVTSSIQPATGDLPRESRWFTSEFSDNGRFIHSLQNRYELDAGTLTIDLEFDSVELPGTDTDTETGTETPPSNPNPRITRARRVPRQPRPWEVCGGRFIRHLPDALELAGPFSRKDPRKTRLYPYRLFSLDSMERPLIELNLRPTFDLLGFDPATGFALTTDGGHLIAFGTDAQLKIEFTDLGLERAKNAGFSFQPGGGSVLIDLESGTRFVLLQKIR